MSEANASNQSEPNDELEPAEDLQFDQAEYTDSAAERSQLRVLP